MAIIFSFIFLFSVSAITATNMLANVTTKKMNTLSMLICASSGLSALAVLLVQNKVTTALTDILTDPLCALLLVMELCSFLLARENYRHNHGNITAIKCAMFSSLLIVPILSTTLAPLFSMSERLTVNYGSTTEFIICLMVVSSLLVAYFYDKVGSGGVSRWSYLILTPISLSMSMLLSASFVQQYNGFAVMLLVNIANGVVFILLSLRHREHRLPAIPARVTGYCIVSSMALIPLNVAGMSLVAAEFITLLKRLSQLMVGVAMDVFLTRRYTLSMKDTIVIITLFGAGVGYYWLRQLPSP